MGDAFRPRSGLRGFRAAAINFNGYDGLNRPASRTYSDGTPRVDYFYDSAQSSNGKGRLTSMTDGVGSESYQYDSMGRILTQTRTTQNVTMNQHYAYNLAGGVVQLWLPEVGNTTQNFTYDNACDRSTDGRGDSGCIPGCGERARRSGH